MKVSELVKGKMYRQKVDSKQGYEDYEYTGVTKNAEWRIMVYVQE